MTTLRDRLHALVPLLCNQLRLRDVHDAHDDEYRRVLCHAIDGLLADHDLSQESNEDVWIATLYPMLYASEKETLRRVREWTSTDAHAHYIAFRLTQRPSSDEEIAAFMTRRLRLHNKTHPHRKA